MDIRVKHGRFTETFRIVHKDGTRYLVNKNGDYLYDVGDTPDELVREMCILRSYQNWKQWYSDPPNASRVKSERTFLKGTWYKEGDSLLESLIKYPKRTYHEAQLMASMDGLEFVDGVARRKQDGSDSNR